MKRKSAFFILGVSILLYGHLAFSLEVDTHESINERLAKGTFNGFSLDNYLKNNLGFRNGVFEKVNGDEVFKLTKEGGRYEDKPEWSIIPYRRSVNHFHNPVTEEGFSGFFFGEILTGDSIINWAQKPLGTQSPGGYYSWHDVRDYYYKAITVIDKTAKEKYFAQTFRGLGQLMHLVQDTSVPSHTRNDTHVLPDYEVWVRKNHEFVQKDPVSFSKAILKIPASGLPITNIFDTNQYGGKNPEITAGTYIGLTEYTNANFFSEDTINSKDFSYPKLDENTPVVERPYWSVLNQPYIRKYYFKSCCGETNGGKGYLLAAVDYNDYWRKKSPINLGERGKIPVLDSNVYRDYASLLLPRAVGYSAGLLEYFFRGNLQVTAIPIFYKNNLYFLRVKVKNLTPGETMKNGSFTLTYRYTPPGGAVDGSNDVYGYAWGSRDSTSAPCYELKEGEEMVIDFLMGLNLIPIANLGSLKFTLAFEGTLGNEEGAVVGKAFTSGEVKFNEEWDNGLNGNHTWGHTEFNMESYNPPYNGVTSNKIEDDNLIKDNLRYQGYMSGRFNQSVLCDICGGYQFVDILPIRITPNTYLMYKIDEMSMNPSPIPASSQFMLLSFTNKLALQISQEGQMEYWNPTTAYYTFPLGVIILDNIYDMFQKAGIDIPEPFYLRMISINQFLYELDDPSSIEHHQRMKVDFIRIIEGKEQ